MDINQNSNTPSNTLGAMDDSCENLYNLVECLQDIQNSKPVYPEWQKYDTKSTMSDNNGGCIKF